MVHPGFYQRCPELCDPAWNNVVDLCEVVTAPRPEPEWPPSVASDQGCPTTAPADFSPCSQEAMRCAWPRETTSACKRTEGTCKAGQWRLAWCGANAGSTLVADPTVCPTGVVSLKSALPYCRPDVEQTCIWKTDNEVCPEVEALCYGGSWRNELCVRESRVVAVHCKGTFTPTYE